MGYVPLFFMKAGQAGKEACNEVGTSRVSYKTATTRGKLGIKMKRLRLSQKTKAYEGVAGIRRIAIAERRPAVPGIVGPTSTTAHPHRTGRRSLRISGWIGGILPIPVSHPLIHVAMHVT